MDKTMMSGVDKETMFTMQGQEPGQPFILDLPDEVSVPLVYNSPHSGRCYPPAFLAASAVSGEDIRRSEDCYIDILFENTSQQGAPFLQATYPRAYLDTNREPYELDPDMFMDELPSYVNRSSERVQAGLGTVPRLVSPANVIYHEKLAFAEAEDRIRRIYFPYHRRLRRLLDESHRQFGHAVLIDCHSFPGQAGRPLDDTAGEPLDIILGDCFGRACSPEFTNLADATFCAMGYRVGRNIPYAGGNNLLLYGRPAEGYHALQIEIRRGLYMDENSFQRTAGFDMLKARLMQWMDVMHRGAAGILKRPERRHFPLSDAAE